MFMAYNLEYELYFYRLFHCVLITYVSATPLSGGCRRQGGEGQAIRSDRVQIPEGSGEGYE